MTPTYTIKMRGLQTERTISSSHSIKPRSMSYVGNYNHLPTQVPTQYLPSSSNGASECKICLLVPLKLLPCISPLSLPHTCPSLLPNICPLPPHPWAMCLMVVRQSPVSVKKKRLIWCHATSHDTRWPQPALNLHLNWGQNSQTGAHSSTTS